VVVTLCDVVRSGCFHLHQVLCGLHSYILRRGTGRPDGRDVYGVASRAFFTDVFGEGTQLSRRRMVTDCPNGRAGGGLLLSLFYSFVREGRVT